MKDHHLLIQLTNILITCIYKNFQNITNGHSSQNVLEFTLFLVLLFNVIYAVICVCSVLPRAFLHLCFYARKKWKVHFIARKVFRMANDLNDLYLKFSLPSWLAKIVTTSVSNSCWRSLLGSIGKGFSFRSSLSQRCQWRGCTRTSSESYEATA